MASIVHEPITEWADTVGNFSKARRYSTVAATKLWSSTVHIKMIKIVTVST